MPASRLSAVEISEQTRAVHFYSAETVGRARILDEKRPTPLRLLYLFRPYRLVLSS